MPSSQKAISQTKEKFELSIEEIVDRDMLDNSSDLRKIYNKTARFNGETYKKKIKYYINDENKNLRLYFDDFTINNAYEISDDAERFIVDTFNTIDAYIDLDFERVYSPRKANITIYKTNKFHDVYEGYSELQWVDDEKIYPKLKNTLNMNISVSKNTILKNWTVCPKKEGKFPTCFINF